MPTRRSASVPASCIRRLCRLVSSRASTSIGGSTRLSRGASHRLSPGPGFGKSTVTAAWAIERSVAWYTIDRIDRSWPIFLRGLCAGLATRVPDAAAGLAAVGVEQVGSGALDSRRAEALAAAVLSVVDPHLDHDIADSRGGTRSCRPR